MASSLGQLLQLNPGCRLTVMNQPTSGKPDLGRLGSAARVRGSADAVLIFVTSLAEAKELTVKAIALLPRDGLLWIAYPKKTSKTPTDVSRDKLWKALEFTAWRPVRQISLDTTWTAMRFRPAALIGT